MLYFCPQPCYSCFFSCNYFFTGQVTNLLHTNDTNYASLIQARLSPIFTDHDGLCYFHYQVDGRSSFTAWIALEKEIIYKMLFEIKKTWFRRIAKKRYDVWTGKFPDRRRF